MSSTTRLLVLGVVRIFQPVHGYEVRRELITWRAREWASVQSGSIYNALKTLTRDGFLEVVGTDQVGGRPERTTYRLTTAGEEEFRLLLREEWWTVRSPTDPLMAAISFTGFVTRSEAIEALEHRTAQIRAMARHAELGIDAHDGGESPPHVREMMRLMNARILAEVAWAQHFIERLQNGEYCTADDPPWCPASQQPPSTRRPPLTSRTPRAARSPGARRNGAPRNAADSAPGNARPLAKRDSSRRAPPAKRTRSMESVPRARGGRRRAAAR